MTLLLDAEGREIPAAVLRACPTCGRDQRETIEPFGGSWWELCSWCGYEFASGTSAPPPQEAT